MIRLRFDPSGSWFLREGASTVRQPVPAPAWEEGLRRLESLNRLVTEDGRPLSSVLVWRGFELWWFRQDRLFRNLLLPLIRYRPLLESLLEAGKVEVLEAPKDFRYAATLLRRAGGSCVIQGERGSLRLSAANFAGFLLKLASSTIALGWALFRPPAVALYALKPVAPELGCDRRFKDIYAELRARGLRFVELVCSVRDHDAWREQRARRRPAIYYHQLGRLLHRTHLAPSRPRLREEPSDRFERAVLDEYWQELLRCRDRVRATYWVLRVVRPRLLLALDDDRDMFSALAAAKAQGLPTVSFQHGVYARYHTGLFCYGRNPGGRNHAADRHFVWSEYFRDRLLQHSRLFTPEQVRVAGHIRHLDRRTSRDGWRPQRKLRVLWLAEPVTPAEWVKEFITAVSREPDMELHYRPRPDGMDGPQRAEIRKWEFPVPFSTHTRLGADLAECDVVIGSYTSVLYESYLHLVPSVVMQVPGMAQDRVREGWLLVAPSPGDLPRVIRAAAALSPAELVERQRQIWGEASQRGYRTVVEECLRWIA